jgi:hypothetical protein
VLIDGAITAVVNHRDTLYFEHSRVFARRNFSSTQYESGDVEYTTDEIKEKLENDCIAPLLDQLPDKKVEHYFGKEHYKVRPSNANNLVMKHLDFRESHSMGLFIPSRHLFGLPERPNKFRLKTTSRMWDEPYRLTAVDIFPYENFSKKPLYSSLPYITGHSTTSGD